MSRRSSVLQGLAGLILGAVLIWLLFRGTDWKAVARAFAAMDPGWTLLVCLLVVASFVARVIRWQFIVGAFERVSFARLFHATQIGFLANFVLPARLGEIIRALALNRTAGVPLSRGLSYVAADRVADVTGLAVVFGVFAWVYPVEQIRALPLPEEWRAVYGPLLTPDHLRRAFRGILVILVAAPVVLAMAHGTAPRLIRVTERLLGARWPGGAHALERLIGRLAEGLSVARRPRHLAGALVANLALWGIFLLTHAALFRAFDLRLPWYAAFVTLSLLALFISVPGPPGFVGPFHAGIMCGLVLADPAVPLDTARALAITGHLVNLIMVVAFGLWSLWTEGVALAELRREALVGTDSGAEGGGDGDPEALDTGS
ncbi:MAG TPA: lysylphosphatidylglycerol synthase transmembrane domain-containing protein [Candidatus Hydrogenedentes bacterium]|nr:lysylphosphatidylglycerol synthase transmembrane domain-containing protein [Candidatus Hydrogenedentota bacterium]